MIRKFVNNKILNGAPVKTVAGAALVISIAGIASRILGLLRDRILASQFGAGDELDIYYAAFRIPDLVYTLMVVGALSAAFIPVFTELITKKDEKKAWELSSGILVFGTSLIIAVSLILVIFAPLVMRIVTPGFSIEKMESVVRLTRIMFLSPLFLGISAVFGGILVSFKRFLVYSLAPIVYNIGIIFGAVFLVGPLGISGLAWGVVIGAFLHMIIQYPAAKSSGFKYVRCATGILKDKNIRRVIRLMIPRSLGMAINQINMLVVTIFASTLVSGSLAAFNFANNLQSVPLGLFGVSFAVAAFPHLSFYAAGKENKKFVRLFSRTFRRVIFFVLPLSATIFVLRAEIVRAVLGAGAFDWEDTVLTLQALGFLSVSLFAQSLIPLLARAFFAIQDTRTPFFIALFSGAINIITIVILIGKFEVIGLAIAFSISSLINMLLLFVFLQKKIGDIDQRRIFSSFLKITVASFVSALSIQLVRYLIGNYIQLETFLEVIFQIIVAGGVGVGMFAMMCYYLQIEEFHDFKKSILVRVFGMPGDVIKDQNGIK